MPRITRYPPTAASLLGEKIGEGGPWNVRTNLRDLFGMVLPGTPKESLSQSLFSFGNVPVKAPPPEGKVADKIAKWIKRAVMEEEGESILEDIIARKASPTDINKRFWGETYWKLPGDAQRKFQKYLKSITGMQPGDVMWIDREGNRKVASDWFDIADIADLGHKPEHLEGIERGYVVLMDSANNLFPAKKIAQKPNLLAE